MQRPYEPDWRLSLLILAVITVSAAALRLPTLGEQSLWFDEAATWGQVNSTLGEIITRTASDNYPPLYNLLAWACVQVFGDAEWVLRLPAALLGIANVPLLYMLGARIGGRSVGLFAALLLTLSGFHIWYSQEARMYTLLAFASTWHGWAVPRMRETARVDHLAMAVVSGAALVYAHPYGALTWIGIGLGAVLPPLLRRDWRTVVPVVVAGLAVGACFLPWAIILLGRARDIATTGFWISDPTPNYVFSQIQRATAGLVWLAVIAPALLLLRNRLRPAPSREIVTFLLLWAIVPGTMGVIASVLVEPVFHSRYLMGSLPPFLVLVAIGLVSPAHSRRGASIAFVACVIAALTSRFATGTGERDNWRDMIATIEAEMQSDDCIVTMFDFHDVAVRYYLDRPVECYIPSPQDAHMAPADSALYLAVAQAGKEAKAEAVAALASKRPLLAEHAIRKGHIYIFGPAARH